MTALPAPRTLSATAFERILLRAASALDGFVAARLERRSAIAHRAAVEAQSTFAAARRAAEARGYAGLLPQ